MRSRSTTARRLGGAAPTLALLVDWLEDEYQNTVMRGALDAARDRGLNLICFSGGVLDSPLRDGLMRNQVFELATQSSVSGVLVLGGTMGNYSGPSRLSEYCKRYEPLPRCCIGIRLAGMPSVLVDNEVGMREAIVHLITAHNKRRIFFVRGPSVNEEAESRFRVYQNVLREHGIEFDERLNYVGDFQPSAGYEAVCKALAAGVQFDAVVAANDSMAMGALRALNANGLRVPADVALAGFDDVEEARYLDPPLTTVRQPLYEQGKEAVRMLLSQIHGGDKPADVFLRTELVTRRSCGCLGTEGSTGRNETHSTLSFEAQMTQRRALVLADLVRSARATFGGLRSGWEGRLVSALVEEVNGASQGTFLSAYNELLQQAFRSENPLEAWHDVLSTLRRHALGMLNQDVVRLRAVEDLFQAARLLASNVVERAQASKRLDAEHLMRQMARAGAALIATFDEPALFDACREQLPNLGVHAVYIVRHKSEQPGQAVLAFTSVPNADSAAGEETFDKGELLPPSVLPEKSPYALVVVPLFFRAETIGYAVFGFGPRNGTLYESLRDQISAALYGARLKGSLGMPHTSG